VATVAVERLLRPEALLEVEVTASATPGEDGLVYLGSLTAPEAGDDLSAQVHAVLSRVGELLGGAGLGLDHVVKTVETTTPATRAAYRATAAVRRELLGPDFPAATGVLAPALERPGALVSIDVIASRHPKTVIDPHGSTRRGITFSPAVRAGDVVFCSGTTAIDPSTGDVQAGGDVVGQAEFVYGELDGLLRQAGGNGLDDLVKTVEFVAPAGTGAYRGVAAVRERLLGRPFPASTGVVCAALLRPEFLIEVDATAVVPTSASAGAGPA
jgi:enamine deaminase RidA (YjgF/YER057c/UK114 family)